MNAEIENKVKQVFDSYPAEFRKTMLGIRTLVYEVANQNGLGNVEETLKWGEPSYRVKGGTPVRIAWSSKRPDQFGVFVPCQTSLIDTCREMYREVFEFESTRAIVFHSTRGLPVEELKHFIFLAMTYHGKTKKDVS